MEGYTKLKKIADMMNRLYPGHLQFVQADALSLVDIVGKIKSKHPMILEVGSWDGYSTAIMANEVREGGTIFTVDHWMGNPDTATQQAAGLGDIYGTFKLNLKRLDLWDIVNPMVMYSETAATIVKDGMMDMIFIDADHLYESIKQDIKLWLPKLKPGGILAGHDAEYYYSKLHDIQKEAVDTSLHLDYFRLGDSPEEGVHPGVVKALYEAFNDKHTLLERRVWYWIKQ